MKKTTNHTVSRIAKLLELIGSQIFTYSKEFPNNYKLNEAKEKIGLGINSLYTYSSFLSEKNHTQKNDLFIEQIKKTKSINVDIEGWQSIINYELLNFNSKGNIFICSISECLIKTLALINIHYQNENNRYTALFRGQVDYKWELISSIGRKIPQSEIPIDRSIISTFELTSLKIFQEKVIKNETLKNQIFKNSNILGLDDFKWWHIKQNYDDDPITGGTRLLDWTSSPLCGLYFACIDWDGNINEDVDGALFVSPRGGGQERVSNSVRLNDPESFKYSENADETISDYFNVLDNPNLIRQINIDDSSQRQIAQDGHFLFQTEFEKPINWEFGLNPLMFIIPGKSKKSILRELFVLGITPNKIIRGNKGILAQSKMKKQLGIYP